MLTGCAEMPSCGVVEKPPQNGKNPRITKEKVLKTNGFQD
jgi:hypothetical protein